MKILFFRHGESQDDLEDRYGGWADFPLTEAGRQTILSCIKNIRALNENFQAVYSSTFQRAFMSAEVVSRELQLPLFPLEFLKERNTYGILNGMIKSEAKEKYPDLVAAVEKKEYIYGAERYEDVVDRIKKTLEILSSYEYESIIAVTHGNFMRSLFKEYCGKEIKKITDGGFILSKVDNNGVEVLSENGIDY
jgi:broad specificity phosphatase PhoE